MVKRGRSRSRSRTPSKRVRRSTRSSMSRKRYSTKRAIPSKSFGQPKTKLVNVPYHDAISIYTAVPGNNGYWQFRANSIFDPDYSGAGHQPLSHDQWALFYNHYVVNKCNATFKFNYDGTETGAFYVGVALSDDVVTSAAGGASSFNTLAENKHVRWKLVRPNEPSVTTLTYNVDVLKFLGRSLFSTDVKAGFGTNPAEGAFFTVFCCPVSSLLAPPVVTVECALNYTCTLMEPKELSGS